MQLDRYFISWDGGEWEQVSVQSYAEIESDMMGFINTDPFHRPLLQGFENFGVAGRVMSNWSVLSTADRWEEFDRPAVLESDEVHDEHNYDALVASMEVEMKKPRWWDRYVESYDHYRNTLHRPVAIALARTFTYEKMGWPDGVHPKLWDRRIKKAVDRERALG